MKESIDRLKILSDNDILTIWNALFPVDDWREIVQPWNITMEDWAQLIYSELSRRGLPSYEL